MPRQSKEEKAKSYLTEGKLQVDHHGTKSALFFVTGQAKYEVSFGYGQWRCSCPSRDVCAHILAAKMVSPLRATSHRKITLGETDDELWGLIDGDEPDYD